MTATVTQKIVGNVGILTFNRPSSMNAFNSDLMDMTTKAMAEFSRNDQVRAIVVHGNGRCFSAGFDMKESAQRQTKGAEAWRKILTYDFDYIMQFWNSTKPTIAAVHGYCLGGAFELMMATDLSVASENAVFGLPEPKFGSPMVTMLAPWVTGTKQAKELMLTGADKISADRIFKMGLINHVVPDANVLEKAMELAHQIAGCAPAAVQKTKQAINLGFECATLGKSLQAGLDIAVSIEADESPERTEFNRIRKESGLKAALDWRDTKG